MTYYFMRNISFFKALQHSKFFFHKLVSFVLHVNQDQMAFSIVHLVYVPGEINFDYRKVLYILIYRSRVTLHITIEFYPKEKNGTPPEIEICAILVKNQRYAVPL